MGLLLLRLQLNGQNPFEELNVIPVEWSPEDRQSAIQFMKETDCLPAILSDGSDGSTLAPGARILVSMLLHDPIERMNATQSAFSNIEEFIPEALEHLRTGADVGLYQNEMNDLSKAIQDAVLVNEETETSSIEENGYEMINPFSFIPYLSYGSVIPNCVSGNLHTQRVIIYSHVHLPSQDMRLTAYQAALSRIPRKGSLNSATRSRLVEELKSYIFDDQPYPYPKKCIGCCALNFLDTEKPDFSPESLINRLNEDIQLNFESHNCKDWLAVETRDGLSVAAGIFGGAVTTISTQKWSAIFQLFLATATGFGTPKEPACALEILQEAFTSGLTEAAFILVRYAKHTHQAINPLLPLRKWLVQLVLYSAGIPSDAYIALSQLDPKLAQIIQTARAIVYNGSTASFENSSILSMGVRNIRLETPAGFSYHSSGSFIVQDELFENSLLHLVAGSHDPDISLISYCINDLKIDKNLRNLGGITPLLMACRSGREQKILALLEHNVDVKLEYPGGETPLHWISLLKEPHQILQELLARGADIHAQIDDPKILPNFLGGLRLCVKGTPLFWAISHRNEKAIDALLQEGIDMHLPCSTGLTPVSYAGRPGKYKALLRLSQHESFRVTRDDANCVLTQWTAMEMLANYVTPEEQEKTLGLVLSSAMPFQSVSDVEDFYRFLVSYAVQECREAIVEILLNGLSLSIATLPDSNEEIEKYAAKPLSNHFWVQYRLVHEATGTGDNEVLSSVLKWGGEATAIDGFERTTLHTLSFSSDNADCVDALISNGALVVLNHRLQIEALTAFGNAVACGNLQIAGRLLSYTSPEDRSLLLSKHPAGMFFSNLSLVGHFVAWSSDLSEKPLEYLFSLPELQEDPDLVFIVDEVMDISALMMACGIKSETSIYDTETFVALRRKRAISLLLKKFPEQRHLDAGDKNNNTALHFAAFFGCHDVAVELIAAGADINIVNGPGFTPLDILFMDSTEFLSSELETKKLMLEGFERGRNNLCMELRSKGAKHNHPLAETWGWTTRLPRPLAKK